MVIALFTLDTSVGNKCRVIIFRKLFTVFFILLLHSCSGFNASLHICGVSRWIVQRLYPYFKRIQDRSRISNVMMSMMNSYSFLRHNATDMCEKVRNSKRIYGSGTNIWVLQLFNFVAQRKYKIIDAF